MTKDKMGSDSLMVYPDGSLQEFLDCDEVIGYDFDTYLQDFVPTKRVQIKYSEKAVFTIFQ